MCPTVAMCRERYHSDRDDGMWQRLLRYDSNLVHIKPVTKPVLSEAVKAQRVYTCDAYLRALEQDPYLLHRYFYIDQKTFLIAPKLGWVIGYKTDREDWVASIDNVTHFNAITHKDEIVEVHTYTMVNWHGGVCGFRICQGTTGTPQTYRASVIYPSNTRGGAFATIHAVNAVCRASSHSGSLWSVSRRSTLHPPANATLQKLWSISA
jgi:hypothetical protein